MACCFTHQVGALCPTHQAVELLEIAGTKGMCYWRCSWHCGSSAS
jgi:hypothetical protein